MTADPDDGKVGYKKPPAHRRFEKGQSGNLRGRPKGSRNFDAIMDELLDQRISVTQNGSHVVMTGRQALAVQMVNLAVAGNVQVAQLLKQYGHFEQAPAPKQMIIRFAKGYEKA